MTNHDIEWLLEFRDEVQADFLRFIVPRPYGRSELLINTSLVEYACSYSDNKSNVVMESSNARLYDKHGIQRWSN